MVKKAQVRFKDFAGPFVKFYPSRVQDDYSTGPVRVHDLDSHSW